MSDPQKNTNTDQEWNLGWDEFWDRDFLNNPPLPESQAPLEDAIEDLPVFDTNAKIDLFSLDRIFTETTHEQDSTPAINWGSIDDLKPTNLNDRIKNLIKSPFSAILGQKEKRTSVPEQAKYAQTKSTKQKGKQSEPGFANVPTFAGDQQDSSSDSQLAFNNLNKVSYAELSEIDSLLDGSLGNAPKVKLDKEIVQDKNINYVAQEKKMVRKQELEKQKSKVKEKEHKKRETQKKKSTSKQTAPTINDIHFDLQKTIETSNIFGPEEVELALERIPSEKERIQKEQNLQYLESEEALNTEELGNALFDDATIAADINAEKAQPGQTTEDLLDNLLNEIDAEMQQEADVYEPSDSTANASLDQDEIISEENIIDDSEEVALQFMDSAAVQAESIFDEFFKQDTENKEKNAEVKLGYKDLLKLKLQELRMILQLCIRFIRDPKYFLTYFQLTTKDVYIYTGIIFSFLTLTGILHLQYLTDRFPMNFF